MNTFSFPQISVNYKDADAAKRIMVNSSRVSYRHLQGGIR